MKHSTPEEVVPPGVAVGGYRVEKKLGAGGQGKVYLAWREGSPVALKFIHLTHVGEWGWRELFIMLRHEFAHVVRLKSHLKWPEQAPQYLVLVMEYVPGRTLHAWAQEDNPSARQVVRVLLKLARGLGEVHAAGVLHRDLKDNNVLVRADGEPVLVDFGAGSMAGTPPATGGVLAPGDSRFRSPESVAFFLREDRAPGERYVYTPADELYALGVILYALLTDTYPIDEPEPLQLGAIVSLRPPPPEEMNERVPRALGVVCMKLLEKQPHQRLATTGALCAALEEVLKAAEGDAAWDVPLFSTWDSPSAQLPVEPRDELQRWMHEKPRRGKRPVPARAPGPLLPAPVSTPTPSASLPWAAVPRTQVLAALLKAAGVLAVLVLLGLGVDWLTHRPGREVAPPAQAPEAGRAAVAPPGVPTPAAEDTAPVKKPPKSPPSVSTPKGTRAAVRNACLGLVGAALQACAGAPPAPTVRREPPPEPCPAGAYEAMTGVLQMNPKVIGDFTFGSREDARRNKPFPVRTGPITAQLGPHWGNLRSEALLFGQLYVGDTRVHARFTRAQNPNGDSFPVCLEMADDHGKEGAELEPESTATTAYVYPMQGLKMVTRFE